MLLLSVVSFALAGDLAVRWDPAQNVRYRAESHIDVPSGVTFLNTATYSARALSIDISMDLDCKGEAARKGWEVVCDVSAPKISGKAAQGEQEALDRAMQENAEILDKAQVKLEIGEDGRLNTVSLTGLEQTDERMGYIRELLRQLVRREVAPLDLQMPKEGDDQGKSWKQTGTPLAVELLSTAAPTWSGTGRGQAPISGGVAGGLALKNAVAARVGSAVAINTEGEGNVSVFVTDSRTVFANVVVSGQGRLDTEHGQIAWRQISASAHDSTGGPFHTAAAGYSHTSAIARINPDGTREGPN